MYELTDQNYLRGMQVTDSAGQVTFTSVFPGCYAGRWPHAHFEIYEALAAATSGAAAITTSQLALPLAECETVYADPRYGDSADNLARLSIDTDGIVADVYATQLVTGTTATLTIRI